MIAPMPPTHDKNCFANRLTLMVGFIFVTFSPDSQILAFGHEGRTTLLWDTTTGQLQQVLEKQKRQVYYGMFSPNGQLFATGGRESLVNLWDVQTGQLVCQLTGDMLGSIHLTAFSPDEKLLAVGGTGKTICLWQLDQLSKMSAPFTVNASENDNGTNSKQYMMLHGHTETILSGMFTPSGKTLVTAGRDSTVRLWDVEKILTSDSTADIFLDDVCRVLSGHASWIWSVTVSPDGKWAASGSEDRTVRIWEIATGEVRHVLEGHALWIFNVAFAPDGRILASGSGDQTIRLWDVETGACLQTIRLPGPYEGMNIADVTGVTPAQKSALMALGAVVS